MISPFAHAASLILTIGVERLPKWVPLGHGNCQDEVLEARDAEDDRVLIVGQVLGSRHRAVQWHVPKAGRGEDRGSEGGLKGQVRGESGCCATPCSISTQQPGGLMLPQGWPKSTLSPWLNPHRSRQPGPVPALRDGDEVAEDLHGDEQSRLEEQAAQHEDADQRPMGTLRSQLFGGARATHQHRHGGGDDQVEEEELEVAQVGVNLGGRNQPLSARWVKIQP